MTDDGRTYEARATDHPFRLPTPTPGVGMGPSLFLPGTPERFR